MTYTKADIEWMKLTMRLKLSKLQTLKHYSIVIFLAFIPLLTVYNLFTMYLGTYDGAPSAEELILPFLAIA